MLQRRNLAIMLGLCLLLTACSGLVTVAKEEVNLIKNGDFAQPYYQGWSINHRPDNKNAEDYIVDGCFTITSSTSGETTSIWQNLSKVLEAGTTYILSFDRYVELASDSTKSQRLYITLNDQNDSTYEKVDGFLRDTDGWVRSTLAFTTPKGFNPEGNATIEIACNITAFEEGDIFKIDNVKLIKSTEWIGFRGSIESNNAIRSWNGGNDAGDRMKAKNSLIDLGDNTKGYESAKDRLCTKYYSARKSANLETAMPVPASVTIAIYETGDAPRLVYVYQKDVSAVDNQVATPALKTVLKNETEYTAKVFAWDSVSGLSPIVPADTLTFTYKAPTT